MQTFREIAIGISRRSYKKELGWEFREDESFARQLENDTNACLVRGYVLYFRNEPAAYVFCRIDHDVVIYKHLGNDERFIQYSPGAALLYLLLERLFEEGDSRLFDFDGMEHIPYKEFFATRVLPCGRVMWFPLTVSNTALVAGHWIITAAWRFVTARRDAARRYHDKWASVRDLSPRWSRILSAQRR
jgi:CelD/BcsL family acetyltransferase involved in cellulose biosynthesis